MAFNFFKGIADFVTPTLKDSHFQEKGVLTPEEFVLAGDLLVLKCPTWAWSAGEASKAKAYLPADKQFLVTRNVPCFRRVSALEKGGEDERVVECGEDGEEGWTISHSERVIPSEEVEDISASKSAAQVPQAEEDDEEALDMDEYDEGSLASAPAPAAAASSSSASGSDDNILKVRTYDLSISYDNYYRSPRMWLVGYNEDRQPLTSEQILEDIYGDYKNKTVTIESHPHLSLSTASIHPCRHAETMASILSRLADDGQFLRVDLALFVFLKFISSVIPTIEYDFTVGV